MKSMTGYGRATAALEGSTLTVQVSSVNRKSLDLTVTMPEEWESLEPAVGELVRKFASRGKVHVDIELTSDKAGAANAWDEIAASEALDRLESFAEKQGVRFEPTAELLWQIANAQRRGGGLPSAEVAHESVVSVLTHALREFAAM